MRSLLVAFVLMFSWNAFAQETRSIYYASHLFERLEAGTFKQLEQKVATTYLYLETTLGAKGRELEDFEGVLKVYATTTDDAPAISLKLHSIINFEPHKGIYTYEAIALDEEGAALGELYVFIHGGENGVEELAIIGKKEVVLYKLIEFVE